MNQNGMTALKTKQVIKYRCINKHGKLIRNHFRFAGSTSFRMWHTVRRHCDICYPLDWPHKIQHLVNRRYVDGRHPDDDSI